MKIKMLKSQFGLDKDSIHTATPYGDFYLLIAFGRTFEVEKCNAEVVE